MSQEEMTSLLPHPSLPMAGGGVVPDVTRVGEWTLLRNGNSTLESRPGTCLDSAIELALLAGVGLGA